MPKSRLANRSVLIVDDEPALLNALAQKFSAAGFVTHAARDGRQALQIAAVKKPDIILLDLLMPNLDGMAVLEAVRSSEWGKGIPVMVLTNLNDPGKMDQAIAHEAYDFLIKSDWSLEEVVQKALGRLKQGNKI